MRRVHTTTAAVVAGCACAALAAPALANHTPATTGPPSADQPTYQAPPNPAPPKFAQVPERPEGGREGDAVSVTLQQLLINQRISQAAVWRADALEERLGNLTGGDIVDGNVTLEKLQGFLDIQSATPVSPVPPASETNVAEPTPSGDTLTLTAAQLLINQRISQAAVRRSNALIDQLAAGLSGANFTDATITAVDLETDLRS